MASLDNTKPTLPIRKLRESAAAPIRAYPGDAGLDLFCMEDIEILPGRVVFAPTGLAIAIPKGTVGLLVPRSSIATKKLVTVANSPGIIDSGYRGEILVALYNFGSNTQTVCAGERIAQLVIVPFLELEPQFVDNLPEYAADDPHLALRGGGGFGSSG